jgi:hypothetical protein
MAEFSSHFVVFVDTIKALLVCALNGCDEESLKEAMVDFELQCWSRTNEEFSDEETGIILELVRGVLSRVCVAEWSPLVCRFLIARVGREEFHIFADDCAMEVVEDEGGVSATSTFSECEAVAEDEVIDLTEEQVRTAPLN